MSAKLRLVVGSDDAGFEYKEALKADLEASELVESVTDVGVDATSHTPYPSVAIAAAELIAAGKADRALLVCGTGLGVAIAANKVPGVRSAPIVDTDTAKLSREHNDLNVLTLGARVLPESRAREIVRTFLETRFEGGRHATRVSKIHSIEPSSVSSRS